MWLIWVGMGWIPDWNPAYYKPEDVQLPYFVQDTSAAREDLANQYTTISRLDQGIGLVMQELSKRNLLSETLILFSSDNGTPFPSGRTNLYDPGIREPLILRFPGNNLPSRIDSLVSLVDIVPTLLDWHGLEIPEDLTGQSLLQNKGLIQFLKFYLGPSDGVAIEKASFKHGFCYAFQNLKRIQGSYLAVNHFMKSPWRIRWDLSEVLASNSSTTSTFHFLFPSIKTFTCRLRFRY